MRVAFPLGGTDWGRSGIGTYVRCLLPHLVTQLRDAGGSLVALGNRRELDAYRAALEGADTVQVPLVFDRPAASAAWYLLDAGRFAGATGADVILYPAAQRRCSLRSPVPTVAVVHDLGQFHAQGKYDPLRVFYFKRLMIPLLRGASRHVAISQATRDDMVQHMGLRGDAIDVVYNGVDCTRFVPMDEKSEPVATARRQSGLEGPYLLYPARLEHPAKNHMRLLAAFAQSAARRTHTLALAGGDWGAGPMLEAEIARLGLTESVRVLGFLPDEIFPGLVAGADGVIMVGLTEGFGLPALEALSAGRAVCAARAGALPEVVGDLAAMCDPLEPSSIATALDRLVGDDALRAQAASEGPGWAAERGWDRTAFGLLRVCQSAVTP